MATNMDARLEKEIRRIADRIPIGIPINSQMSAAPTTSVMDTGSLRAISSFTGMKLP